MSLLTNNTPFGLDISDEILRLVQIKKRRRQQNFITAAAELRLPEGVIINGQINNDSQLIKSIKQLIVMAKISSREVISVLPEKKTFIKLIKAKAPTEPEIRDSLKKEIPRHIPLEVEEIDFDWQTTEKFQPNKITNFLVGVAPKTMVTNYLNVLKNAHLTPLALEIEAAAITRCLLDETIKTGPKIIIDMGAVRTSLTLYHNQTIQFSVSLPISGNQITKKIAATLNLKPNQAEKAKVTCGLDEKKCDGALKKILSATVSKLTNSISEAIDFYQAHFQNKGQIEEIILTGGGANLINIDRLIAEKTGIPTILGNPLSKIKTIDKSISLTPAKLQSFTTAIGLALRAFQNNHVI